jgi:type IV pilus assembly protein PilN
MIRINLVAPEKPEKARKKAAAGGGGGGGVPSAPGAFQAYLLLTLFAGGAAFLCAAAWWFKDAQLKELDRRIAADEKRQRDLQAIKVQVDAFQAKKILLENKVNLIERLRAEQKSPVHMLDEISKALPDFVWLTGMDENGGKVGFKGQSNSLTAVADFISALQRSGWFPTVDLMSSTEQQSIVTFDLSSQFKNPEIAAKQAAAAAAAAAAPPPGAPPR